MVLRRGVGRSAGKMVTDLEKNPDFAVTDSAKWERHVIHRLQLEQDEACKKKREMEDAQGEQY